MTTTLREIVRSAAVLLSLMGWAEMAHAQVAFSPDTTVGLAGSIVPDERVVRVDPLGGVTLVDLGPLPGSVEVDGYDVDAEGHVFSLDATIELPGGLLVGPADVVRYDGDSYSLAFDAAGENLPRGANVDGVSIDGAGFVLSFDTTVDLGSGTVVADEDLVLFSGGSFLILFDGSAAGVDPALDLDAVKMVSGGGFYASFDVGGSFGGLLADDDSVVLYSGSGWTSVWDLSDANPGSASADVIAVPEPSMGPALLSGAAFLVLVSRRKWGGEAAARFGSQREGTLR